MASGRRTQARTINEIVDFKVERWWKASLYGGDPDIILWGERIRKGSVHHKI